MPYLKELKSMQSQAYMKYKVHLDLKNFQQALREISQSEDDDHFREALLMVRKQRLFNHALDCYSHDEKRLKSVKVAFGEYLEERGYTEEAASLYLAGEDHRKALKAYLKCLNIDMTLAVLGILRQEKTGQDEETKKEEGEKIETGDAEYDEEEDGLFGMGAADDTQPDDGGDDLDSVRSNLIEGLILANRHTEAADLLSDPAFKDTFNLERAFESYVKANNWDKAHN